MTNEFIQKSREENFDNIVGGLRQYIVDDGLDGRYHVAFLLSRLHCILGDIFDKEVVSNNDCIRMLDRVSSGLNGKYFLYVDGGVSEGRMDEKSAADLISVVLRRYNRYKRKEILRRIENKLDRVDEENAYLRRMEEEGSR
jgi:hypothetical protein